MLFKTLLLAATAVTSVFAAPHHRGNGGGNNGRVPGYPYGNPQCMDDDQAAFIVKTFKSILMNTNRTAAVQTATTLIADSYVETSDSINVLAGYPQGGPSFNGKDAYIAGVQSAPPIQTMTDLDIWHDCTKIGWQWLVDNLAMDVSPVKGFNKFTIDPRTGIAQSSDLEFNSIAWGEDLGGKWTAPAYQK